VIKSKRMRREGYVARMGKIKHRFRTFTPRVIKSKRMRREGYVARMGKRRGQQRDFIGTSDGRSPLESHRHGWDDNI